MAPPSTNEGIRMYILFRPVERVDLDEDTPFHRSPILSVVRQAQGQLPVAEIFWENVNG